MLETAIGLFGVNIDAFTVLAIFSTKWGACGTSEATIAGIPFSYTSLIISALVSPFLLLRVRIFPSKVRRQYAAVVPGSIPKMKYFGFKSDIAGRGSRERNSTLFRTGEMIILKSPPRFVSTMLRMAGKGAYATSRALAYPKSDERTSRS